MSQNSKKPSSKPFTYLIGWSAHRQFYYGVRYGNGVTPESLWVSYFTSSKHVKRFREIHGEPDIISVRKVFDDIMEAREWEWKVLRRMHVLSRTDFLNRTEKPAPPSRLGAKHTPESRVKMQKPMAAARKQKISDKLKGTNQKRWLITTPETSFCVRSLDAITENWPSLYGSFRSGKPMSRGKLKGWKLEQLE